MNHIEQTIADLEARKEKLDGIIIVLRELCEKSSSSPPSPQAKRTYKKRAVGAPQTPQAQVSKIVSGVLTLAGAMKIEILKFSKPFLTDELRQAVKTRHPDFSAAADTTGFYGNLSYWASKEKLEKVGAGSLASYRIIDRDFFQTLMNP